MVVLGEEEEQRLIVHLHKDRRRRSVFTRDRSTVFIAARAGVCINICVGLPPTTPHSSNVFAVLAQSFLPSIETGWEKSKSSRKIHRNIANLVFRVSFDLP